MIVCDSNILSAVTAEHPDAHIVSWLNAQPRSTIFTTVVTVFELWVGVEILKPGRRRVELGQRTSQLLTKTFSGRILPLTEEAAHAAAVLAGERRPKGIVIDPRDTLIAGICRVNGATLVTRNIKHFEDAGILLVNPWTTTALPPESTGDDQAP